VIVRWNEVLSVPSDIHEKDGLLCECGKLTPHEHVEFYAISDGRLLHVKSVQTHGKMIRITIDA
jgi:hypothetical protein